MWIRKLGALERLPMPFCCCWMDFPLRGLTYDLMAPPAGRLPLVRSGQCPRGGGRGPAPALGLCQEGMKVGVLKW